MVTGHFAAGATVEQTALVDPVYAEQQGRVLSGQILAQQPGQPLNSSGLLLIRDAKRKRIEIPVRFQVTPGETNWQTTYETIPTNGSLRVKLTVIHTTNQPGGYQLETGEPGSPGYKSEMLDGNRTMISFAGSDFWLIDLGLEFFHWPRQLLLGREVRQSQSCYKLESINPNPAPGAYARVVTWLDIATLRESGQAAIIHAEAFDSENKILKEFDPKEFQKVNGDWELKEMEIDNRQTKSRTQIKFDLGTK